MGAVSPQHHPFMLRCRMGRWLPVAFLLVGGGWGARCLPRSLGLGCRHSEEPNEDAAHTGLWQHIHLWLLCSDKPLGSAVAAVVNGTIHHGGRQASGAVPPPEAVGRAWPPQGPAAER